MAFLERSPVFMSKPTVGSCGRGIEKLNTADFPSLDAVYDHLAEHAGQLELEAVIQQHPACYSKQSCLDCRYGHILRNDI